MPLNNDSNACTTLQILSIDFNGIWTNWELFYVEGLGNRFHCKFIYTFFV